TCRSVLSIARRSMAAPSRATPIIRSCALSHLTPATLTRRGLGGDGECAAVAPALQHAIPVLCRKFLAMVRGRVIRSAVSVLRRLIATGRGRKASAIRPRRDRPDQYLKGRYEVPPKLTEILQPQTSPLCRRSPAVAHVIVNW